MISDLESSREANVEDKSPKLAEVPAVLIRGGTSKGVFLHARDIPPSGPERDRLILRLMGSPDPMQIDGLGGTYSSTSKVVVVEPGPEDGMVTYWFGQVGIDSAKVEWAGNCGNLTTAVGSFAIDEKLVPARAPMTTVRLLNGNTGITVEAQVPVAYGRARTEGGHKVAGVPGSGAPVMMRYLDPGGGVLGKVLPTGNVTDQIETPFGEVAVSLVDVTHPYVFVHAKDLDLQIEDVRPGELNEDSRLLRRLENIRAACAVRAGIVDSPDAAAEHSALVPRLIVVQEPTSATLAKEPDASLVVMAISMGKIHRAVPLTGALCCAAATLMPGTIPYTAAISRTSPVRLSHPRGTVQVVVGTVRTPSGICVTSVGTVSTARRIFAGTAYLS